MHNCEICSYKSKLSFGIIYHVRRHHLNSQAVLFSCEKYPELYSCPHCHFETDLSTILKEHIINLHRNEEIEEHENFTFSIYKCETCKFQTFSVLVMLKHIADGCAETTEPSTFQGKRLECDQCAFVINHKDNLNTRKIQKHISPENVKQKQIKTTHKSCLPRHMHRKHSDPSDIKWFECDWCEYRSKQKSRLRNHVIYVYFGSEHIAKFACDQCSYATVRKSSLKNHKTQKHVRPEDVKWLKCDRCELKFKRRNLLRAHVKRKHEVRRFECAHCSYKTVDKSNFNSHLYIKHSDPSKIKWFECDKCFYKSKYKGDLKIHVNRIHLRVETKARFTCDKCSYVAKRKDYLSSHIISKHTSEEMIKWHKCAQCPYLTKLKRYLTRHQLRVHGKLDKHGRTYKCVNK